MKKNIPQVVKINSYSFIWKFKIDSLKVQNSFFENSKLILWKLKSIYCEFKINSLRTHSSNIQINSNVLIRLEKWKEKVELLEIN